MDVGSAAERITPKTARRVKVRVIPKVKVKVRKVKVEVRVAANLVQKGGCFISGWRTTSKMPQTPRKPGKRSADILHEQF